MMFRSLRVQLWRPLEDSDAKMGRDAVLELTGRLMSIFHSRSVVFDAD